MRNAFLLDPDLVFLNHGSFGACPREVFRAYRHWQLELERNPVAFLGRRSAQLLLGARRVLADRVGASAEDLVFLPNATTGVNTVARSMTLQAGDEVVTTDHEYGACEAAWRFVCAERGAVYRPLSLPLPFDADDAVQRITAALSPRTRVLYLSHITSTTALILPVADLCAEARRRGITTVVDGAHAPGQIEIDLEAIGADFTTGNCHKWLCAPKGAAFLHARAERHAELHAAVVSWGYAVGDGGHSGFDAYTGHTLLERRLQWQGTRDIAAFLAVPAAIEFQDRHSWPALRQRCHAMAIETRNRVLSRNGLQPIAADSAHAQMVPIPVRTDDGDALRRWLFDQHRIEVPVIQHGEQRFVRVSVQAYNTQADLDALVQALAEAGV
ncbi:MAG: aminotransferase class V-fold PLP-dependent enzyme [Rubrivivax sp.]